MMPSILQYYLEFANFFWNHPTFSTMKKSNFLVYSLDSFWMTASMSSVLQTACCDFSIPLVNEHLTIDPILSKSFYLHVIQNNWMIDFSPGNFLLHTACLQQLGSTPITVAIPVVYWTVKFFTNEFKHPVFKLLNLLMGMFLIFRNVMAPLAIVPYPALNLIQIGYIATVSLFAEYANEVWFSPCITSIFIW